MDLRCSGSDSPPDCQQWWDAGGPREGWTARPGQRGWPHFDLSSEAQCVREAWAARNSSWCLLKIQTLARGKIMRCVKRRMEGEGVASPGKNSTLARERGRWGRWLARSSFRRAHHLGEAAGWSPSRCGRVAGEPVQAAEAPVITEEIWMGGRSGLEAISP